VAHFKNQKLNSALNPRPRFNFKFLAIDLKHIKQIPNRHIIELIPVPPRLAILNRAERVS
jgi:hypothetical protein